MLDRHCSVPDLSLCAVISRFLFHTNASPQSPVLCHAFIPALAPGKDRVYITLVKKKKENKK